jgi:hypothetical protein
VLTQFNRLITFILIKSFYVCIESINLLKSIVMKKKLAIACLIVFAMGLSAPAFAGTMMQEPEKKEACEKKAECDKEKKAECCKEKKAECDKEKKAE